MAIFVIAEIGVNHDGSLEKAKRLIDAAALAGADAVKFQHFSSERLWGDLRIAHLELAEEELTALAGYGGGPEFMCTPFGVPEVEFLAPLVKRMKVASGCLRRSELLRAVAATGLPVILSTGMSTLSDVSAALVDLRRQDVLHRRAPGEITLLHCTSAYPCPVEAVNLWAMATLAGYFMLPVGYSDHTAGITVSIAAAAMGAKVIEKHLTLNRSAAGPDHKASIEPEEFRVMVNAIRTVEAALGNGVKLVQPCEEKLRRAWREPVSSHSSA